MRPYNVEFFDRDLNFLHHDLITSVDVDDDYLAISTNSITINQTSLVEKCGFIYISGGNNEFFGIVTDVSDDDYTTTVSFKSALSLFDQNVVFDTSLQNGTTTSLEKAIADIINQYWINTGDSYQSMSVVKTDILTSTTSWNFNITVDDTNESGITKKIVNFYTDILTPALTSYGVAITPVFSITKKILTFQIGTSSASQYIEADLPTVTIDTFTINQASSNINKLEIWNADNFEQKINYFYHTDNTYTTTDEKRVTPVVLEVLSASPSVPDVESENWSKLAGQYESFTLSETTLVRYGCTYTQDNVSYAKYYYKKLEAGTYSIDSNYYGHDKIFGDPAAGKDKQVDKYTLGDSETLDSYQTFEDAAADQAYSQFAGRTWTNLIELTVGLDDALINPLDLKFGQTVQVIHNGMEYTSIFTGKKFSTTMTLTFGTVRMDLTKQLKMGG